MRYLYVVILTTCALAMPTARAQESFEAFRDRMNADFEAFSESQKKEFEEFRNKLNQEYAEFVEKSWEAFDKIKGISRPKEEETVPPVVYPDDDGDEPIKDEQKPIEEVIPVVKPKPQPRPVVPIEDEPKPQVEKYHTFRFFNTDLKVRLGDELRFKLQGCDKREVAKAWKELSGTEYNNAINDCLSIREQRKLCDWAYLLMLDRLGQSFLGSGSNEAVMFTAYVYCQSGYKMRLATDGSRLYLLYASDYLIYRKGHWNVDGEKYYALDCDAAHIYICQAAFPQERALSLQMQSEPTLAVSSTEQRSLKATGNGVSAVVSTNENLLKFYDTYPTAMIGDNFVSQWAMYANTPLSRQARETLYPALEKSVKGKDKVEAAGTLLNFVQTAFVYEYDDKVWGHERAFFPDETLYYPYCDCEDRSILFSRLVRDLLGLDVVLIYYPGHLATAVCFPDNVKGDYVVLDGKRYTVCDPTYTGAPVGATMPGMDNKSAKVILLE